MNFVQVYNLTGTKSHYNMPLSYTLSHIYNSNLPQIRKTYCSPVNQYHNFVSMHLSIYSYDTPLKLDKNYCLTTAYSFNRFDYEMH